MAIQTDSELKTYVQFDDVPTEEQFGHIIDSKWNKLDDIPQAKISGLVTALNNKVDKVAGKGLSTNDFTDILKAAIEGFVPVDETNGATTYTKNFLAGVKLESLWLKSATDATVTLKFNGVDYTEIELLANKKTGLLLMYNCDVDTTLSITSLPINSQIEIYKR